MALKLADLERLSEAELARRFRRNPEAFLEVVEQISAAYESDRSECALAHYTLANPMAAGIHTSRARELAVVGGNRSTKTSSVLAELAIQATGLVPDSLKAVYPREKLRPPIRARVVCNSLTDTLLPIILPKLRFDQWNGVGAPSEGRGHWGWIPRRDLKEGKWESSWSANNRTLYVAVDSTWVGAGGAVNTSREWSSIQANSYDQDLTSFVGSSLHLVIHDELPPEAIYRENKLRTLDTRGQIITAFTPPDEVGAGAGSVNYFFDQVYEKGLPGPEKHPDVETIILHTERNRILSPEAVAELESRLTPQQREVRLYGKFIHLSGVIYPLFTQESSWWCFKCVRKTLPLGPACTHCGSTDVEAYTHVADPFDLPRNWPIVFVIDPHPRKPDMMIWAAISPSDDVYVVEDLAVEGTAADIAKAVREVEDRNRWYPAARLMDPNIMTETNDKLRRGWTIGDAYREVGLHCSPAVDNMNVGIESVREAMKPDRRTRRPRLQFFPRCGATIRAHSRWRWQEWKSRDRDLKERPDEAHKDPCDCVRYLMADNPTFARFNGGNEIYRRNRG